ncbi:MAG TPA: hypothetical protein VGA22_01560 [Gemmatimonadales bacterium]|jgi:hypothetical protein
MRLRLGIMTIPVMLAVAAGCSSQGGVQNAPLHAGVGRTFEADFDRTLDAAREAAVESGLRIESATQVDDNTYMIMTKATTSAWSWGEIVRLVVVREAENSTTVRVYSKRKVSINVTARGDYSNTILSNIELKLRAGE